MPITMSNRMRSRRALKIQDGMTLLYEYLRDISKWTETVKDRLKRVYLIVADNGLIHVYAIQRQDRYDFQLSQSLSDFTQDQFEIGVQSSGHVLSDGPDEELAAFFNPDEAYLIHVV